MARRRFNTTRSFQRSRRESMWIALSFVETDLTAGTTAVLTNSLNAAALALRPFTVVRTRLFFHNRSNQLSDAEDYGANIAMAVVSDQSVAIGVTAVPTPTTDQGSDLFHVFASLGGYMGFLTAIGFGEMGKETNVDSKAMRKVNDDQDLILVQEGWGALVTSGGNTMVGGRILIKLH